MGNLNGFKFSVAQTYVMHFHTLPSAPIPPELFLDGQIIPYVITPKFLGLIWDRQRTWKPHINLLKASCKKTINLINSLTSTEWSAEQESLLYVLILSTRQITPGLLGHHFQLSQYHCSQTIGTYS